MDVVYLKAQSYYMQLKPEITTGEASATNIHTQTNVHCTSVGHVVRRTGIRAVCVLVAEFLWITD